jgi:hypothetical protein
VGGDSSSSLHTLEGLCLRRCFGGVGEEEGVGGSGAPVTSGKTRARAASVVRRRRGSGVGDGVGRLPRSGGCAVKHDRRHGGRGGRVGSRRQRGWRRWFAGVVEQSSASVRKRAKYFARARSANIYGWSITAGARLQPALMRGHQLTTIQLNKKFKTTKSIFHRSG